MYLSEFLVGIAVCCFSNVIATCKNEVSFSLQKSLKLHQISLVLCLVLSNSTLWTHKHTHMHTHILNCSIFHVLPPLISTLSCSHHLLLDGFAPISLILFSLLQPPVSLTSCSRCPTALLTKRRERALEEGERGGWRGGWGRWQQGVYK